MNFITSAFMGFLLSPIFISAQALSPTVIGSSGEHYTNNSIQLSWTLGELMTETLSNSSQILTQGFHQPSLEITSISPNAFEGLSILIFPNPSASIIHIEVDGVHMPLTWEIHDMMGKAVLNGDQFKTSTSIDVNQLSPAVYSLILIRNETKEFKSYRIQKQ